MKVLYIANNQTNDFLSDAVFHGLHDIQSVEVIDSNRLWYMYNSVQKSSLVNRFHGRGFTYYADVEEKVINREGIDKKIFDRYFDRIIYGNVARCRDYLSEVLSNYPKENIIFLDGEDEHNRPGINSQFVNLGKYYRRELSIKESEIYPQVKPISFAYPENKMPNSVSQKQKLLAQVIPGVPETFVFDNEDSYFEDYRISMFAYTWRKAGWDCLRHYEILGNGCVPLFLDIESCPTTICTTIPKDKLINFYKASGIYDLFDMSSPAEYDDRRAIVTNKDLTKINDLKLNDEFFTLYFPTDPP